jgi:eukaryotic-like serine/threonine-protein kinase
LTIDPLGATAWPEVDRLLDQALSLAPAQRTAWLEALPPQHAALRATLQRLLGVQARIETGDFLGTLPKLDAAGAAQASSAAAPADLSPQPGATLGPWRLLRELGAGGMGSVWLAERADGSLKRQVALKLPRLAWAPDLTARLTRERDILASLEHPHIARLYDAGVDALGRPWLALEFVDGLPIDVHCRDRALPLRSRVQLLLQVASAVAFAHARLVIHRDLKPHNILVTGSGEVKLLDFGIAKLLEGDTARATALTHAAGRALTPDYASPEQIAGLPLGTPSDVYSLGVVAFELLAGARPYRLKRGSAAALEEAIASVDSPRASTLAADAATARALRGDLDAILAQALRKIPAERYPTVQALADDWQRWLDGRPVRAMPDRLGYRLRRTLRRHWLPASAATVTSLALVAGASIALWQAQQARSEARTAEAVQQFLEGVLGASDPNQRDPASARDRTARELMDIGAQRVESELADEPAARVRVLGMLAGIYENMGEFDQAVRMGELRVALLARSPGVGTPEHLVALSELMTAQRQLGRGDTVLRMVQELENGLAGLRQHDPVLRARILNKIATVLDTQDPPRARRAALQAVELLEPDGPRVVLAEAWRLAGIASSHAQAFEDARAALRRARDLAVADGGIPVALVDTLAFLGRTETQLGHLDDAETALREAARLSEVTLGAINRRTILAQEAVASFLVARGRIAESLELYAEARAAVARLPAAHRGADLVATIASWELGALHKYGHVAEALGLVDDLLTGSDLDLAPIEHRVGVLNQRALLWITAGQVEPAARSLAEAQRAIEARNASGNPVAAAVQLAQSRLRLLQGRPAEALPLLAGAVRQLDGTVLANAHHPADLALAAQIAIAQRQWDAAITWAERALARTPGRGLERSFDGAVAWHALGAAQFGAGRLDEARASLQRSAEQFEALADPDRSPHLARALLDLGRALDVAGQSQEARAVQARAQRMLSKLPEPRPARRG